MNLPLIWIGIPILFATMALFMRQRKQLYFGLLVAVSASLSVGAFLISALFSSSTLPLTWSEELFLLGRTFSLTVNDLSLVGLLYSVTTLWILSLVAKNENPFLPSFCMIYSAVNIASFAVDPFLYSALIIFIANSLFIPVMAQKKSDSITGRLRFLVFQLLAVFLVLLAGWVLAGGEIAPVDEEQLFFASVLLGLGISLWLGAFPFHTWIPLLADESPIIPYGFAMTYIPISGILMLLKFVNNFAWLREYDPFFPALQILGMVMIIAGGIGAFFQKKSARLLGFVVLSGIGLLLLGVGFTEVASTDLLSVWLVPFIIGLFSIVVAYRELSQPMMNGQLDEFRGGFYKYPIYTILLLSGFGSIVGYPLFAGFAPMLFLYENAFKINQTAFIGLLLGQIILAMTWIRLFLRLTLRIEKEKLMQDQINLDRILPLLVILLNVIIGIFPEKIYRIVIEMLGKIFPLL